MITCPSLQQTLRIMATPTFHLIRKYLLYDFNSLLVTLPDSQNFFHSISETQLSTVPIFPIHIHFKPSLHIPISSMLRLYSSILSLSAPVPISHYKPPPQSATIITILFVLNNHLTQEYMDSYQTNHSKNTEHESTPIFNLESTPTRTSFPNHTDVNIPSQGTTILSPSNSNLHHLPLQQSDSSGELFVPELEPVFWSDEEEQYPQLREKDNFFTLQTGQTPLPDMRHESFQQHDSSFRHPGPASCTPSSPRHTFMQPSPLPHPNVANPMDFTISPTQKNAASFADAWLNSIHQDLSRFPALRNDIMQNRGNDQSIPHHANSSLQQDLFDSPALQTETLPNQGHVSISDQADNTDIGAYVPLHYFPPGDTNGAGPSNSANSLHQLYDADDQQEQRSMLLNNSNVLISNSSMTGLHQHRQQAPHQLYFSKEQRNPYIQEHIARGTHFNSTAPADTPVSQPLPVREGVIKKPSHDRGSRNLVGKIQCEECPEVFESKLNALRHLQHCHIKKKKFACIYCSASYGGSGSRTRHMRKAHPQHMPPIPASKQIINEVDGKVRYFCWVPNCTKSYTVQSNLNRHFEMEHLKIRYTCKCGTKATTKYNLQTHQAKCPIYQAKYERDSNTG